MKTKRAHWHANDVTPIIRQSPGCFGFERSADSKTLACLHGCREVFQGVLSQAGSYLLTGKFHDSHRLSIGKAEGGFWIPSHGEFVLTPQCVWMDSYNARTGKENAAKASEALTELVTHIVLNWEPARHEDSLYEVAAAHAGTTPSELRAAVEGNPYYRITVEYASRGMQFTNPISYFFGWNTSDKIPYDAEFRDFWIKSSPTLTAIIANEAKLHAAGQGDGITASQS